MTRCSVLTVWPSTNARSSFRRERTFSNSSTRNHDAFVRCVSRPALAFALAVAAMAQAMPASAEDSKSAAHTAAFSERILGSDANRHDASACFIRSYDAAHLAQHPDQKVTRILVLLKREGQSSEEDVSRWRFRFGVNLRKDPASYRTGGIVVRRGLRRSRATLRVSSSRL